MSQEATLVLTDEVLYRRGVATLLASWEEYATGATGATVRRLPGVSAAVFPNHPEREVYNNAVIEPFLGPDDIARAVDAMETAYSDAGVTRFAAWVREVDGATAEAFRGRGYSLDTTTRAMGMPLDDLRLPRPELEVARRDWGEYLRILGVPPDFLGGADPAVYNVVVAALDGENVAAAMAYDFDGDCGIYNVGTLEHARRRGLGTAITTLLLYDALERGCTSASLQSTPMAEGVYYAAGFRDLGRTLEFVPGTA
jgi:GNAT superfamily N-acetyltransferase